MADYTQNQRWAEKAGRRQISLYLPCAVLDAMDELAELWTGLDAITGKERKMGRAGVIERIVDRSLDIWGDAIESYKGVIEDYQDLYQRTSDANDEYISDLANSQKEVVDAEQLAASKQQRIDELEEELKRSRLLHSESAWQTRLDNEQAAYAALSKSSAASSVLLAELIPDEEERARRVQQAREALSA